MIVEVAPDSPVPAYEQLRQQITRMITSGTLRPGDQLPPIRQLAHDLDLAPGTIAHAYRELEQAGLVTARSRRGTVVTDQDRWHHNLQAHARDHELKAAARTYALTARQLDIPPDHALTLVKEALDDAASTGRDIREGDEAAAE